MTRQNSSYKLEICVDSPSAAATAASIADRIELCAGLSVGGLTPDFGIMQFAASLGVETHVLIRPRCGDFSMSPDDISVAVASIKAVQQLGLRGVVIGAERNGALDRRALEAMILAADDLDLTLHRVIDVVDDPKAAVNLAVELGFIRVLTSGGSQSAADGTAGLKRLHATAGSRIEIMAGGGVNSANLQNIMDSTQITSFHASCSMKTLLAPIYARYGFGETKRVFDQIEAEKLAALLHGQLSKSYEDK